MPEIPQTAQPLPGVELPKGRDWAYFAVMSMSAALFGGVVLHFLHKYDPIGRLIVRAKEASG